MNVQDKLDALDELAIHMAKETMHLIKKSAVFTPWEIDYIADTMSYHLKKMSYILHLSAVEKERSAKKDGLH